MRGVAFGPYPLLTSLGRIGRLYPNFVSLTTRALAFTGEVPRRHVVGPRLPDSICDPLH